MLTSYIYIKENFMDISFCSLRAKDVINMCDGRNLGNITDIIFDSTCGRILGLIVPCNKGFFSMFKSNNDIFIPYNRICKIGKDIILVDIIMQTNCYCDDNIINTCSDSPFPQPKQKFSIQSVLNELDNKDSK